MTEMTIQAGTKIIVERVPNVTAALRHRLASEGKVILHSKKV